MSFYLNELDALVEATTASRDADQRISEERMTPLKDRLERLLQSIPIEAQREGLSLPALQEQLRARGRGHTRCHPGELGHALRRLGFVRVRRWSNSNEFGAIWRRAS